MAGSLCKEEEMAGLLPASSQEFHNWRRLWAAKIPPPKSVNLQMLAPMHLKATEEALVVDVTPAEEEEPDIKPSAPSE